MNKIIFIASIVAVYAALAEAATNEEVKNAVETACQEVRQERLLALKSAIRDSMISATSPQQKSCIKWQISSAAVGINHALNAEQAAAESEFLTLPPQEVDAATVSQQARERCSNASAAYSKESLISQCPNVVV